MPLEDLGAAGKDEQQKRIQEELSREQKQSFDLSRGPLLRMKLLKLGENEHVLLRTVHHIIWDGWSEGIQPGIHRAL